MFHCSSRGTGFLYVIDTVLFLSLHYIFFLCIIFFVKDIFYTCLMFVEVLRIALFFDRSYSVLGAI